MAERRVEAKISLRDEWMTLLQAADCICAPVATYEDLVNDPQLRANEYIVEVDHPTQGRMAVVGAPWRFSETPAEIAPALARLLGRSGTTTHTPLSCILMSS